MIRIGIVDDHVLFRESLNLLINNFQDMEVVLEASNGNELLEKLKTNSINILLLDLQMPEMDGFETSIKVKELFPDIKILILTFSTELDTIRKIMQMDVQGYFTKNTSPDELEKAIRRLDKNGFYFEKKLSSVIEKIMNTLASNENSMIVFSDREMEIIYLTLKEYNGMEIAEKLSISPRTVEVHKRNLMEKTGSKNFMGVVVYALLHKLISLNDLNQ